VFLPRGVGQDVLLVKPTYKPGWDLPGGMAEANEPPHEAATRELKEELGLAVVLRDVLVIDWVSPHGPWDDQISFIFDGGTVSAAQAADIRPHDEDCPRRRSSPRPGPANVCRHDYAIASTPPCMPWPTATRSTSRMHGQSGKPRLLTP
jgi:ADP-ribose pyrophosphatase YjhB (NUDIX family)